MTAETADRASPGEASFQLLAEHLPDLVIFAFDADLRIWAATVGGIRAHGWTSEEFIGMTVPEIAGATRAEDIRACCQAALAGERTQLEMAGFGPPDRLWSLTFVPLDGGVGPGGGMVLCRDVTGERRAEERLRASQRQLAEAQRIAQVGSWEWDLATDELTVSGELCRLFGLPVDWKTTMTEGVASAIHPADRERVVTALERIRDDPSPFALEHRIIRPDGEVRTVLARGEGVVDEDGRPVRFIGTDQDITDRRRADAERRAACSTGPTRPRRAGTAAWPPTCTTGTSRAWPRSASSSSRPGCGSGPAARPRSTNCSGRSPGTCRPR